MRFVRENFGEGFQIAIALSSLSGVLIQSVLNQCAYAVSLFLRIFFLTPLFSIMISRSNHRCICLSAHVTQVQRPNTFVFEIFREVVMRYEK